LDTYSNRSRVNVGHFQQGMGRPRVVDGGDSFQIRRVAVNILNKQPRTADKGWVGRGANNCSS